MYTNMLQYVLNIVYDFIHSNVFMLLIAINRVAADGGGGSA